MNYKLAKQLKDAGFPMPKHDIDIEDNTLCHRECDWATKWGATSFCEPNLSELIDACGDEFDNLYRGDNNKNVFWIADSVYIEDKKRCSECKMFKGESFSGKGKTDKEAVAKLWLKLNEKEKEINFKTKERSVEGF